MRRLPYPMAPCPHRQDSSVEAQAVTLRPERIPRPDTVATGGRDPEENATILHETRPSAWPRAYVVTLELVRHRERRGRATHRTAGLLHSRCSKTEDDKGGQTHPQTRQLLYCGGAPHRPLACRHTGGSHIYS
uniref:Uncharacterized protein n=1 Tax=Molossus molossus TaxID=27622 RepID=A0A7J8DPJ6_MOLMO|nr:hypothetical protein HJG59_009225 [Molossus molossus]